MKKIGYFAHTGDLSGPNHNLLRLLQALDRSLFEPVVYFPGHGQAIPAFVDMDVQCRVIPMAPLERAIARIPLYLADVFRVTRLARQAFIADALDLVHVNTCVTPYPGLAARSLGLPLVWHVRECLRPNRINDLYLAGIVNLAHRLVTVSGAVRAHVERRVRRRVAKAVIVNNGIDLDRFQESMGNGRQSKRDLGLPEGQTLIVLPAFLLPHKGQEVMLEAAALLVHRMNVKRICVLFAGDEPASEKGVFTARLMERCRSLNLDEHVQFLGLRTDLPAILGNSDIVCLPSICEDSFPNGVLEGMAAGKPVVATRVGGIPEMVVEGETGILVSRGRSEELAVALAALIGDEPKSARFGLAGRRRVGREFTSRLHADRIQAVYSELLGHA